MLCLLFPLGMGILWVVISRKFTFRFARKLLKLYSKVLCPKIKLIRHSDNTEVYDYVYYLCTTYYNNYIKKLTTIWFDISVVLFDHNVRLMKTAKMSAIITTDMINNSKYYLLHKKIRNNATTKRNYLQHTIKHRCQQSTQNIRNHNNYAQ